MRSPFKVAGVAAVTDVAVVAAAFVAVAAVAFAVDLVVKNMKRTTLHFVELFHLLVRHLRIEHFV